MHYARVGTDDHHPVAQTEFAYDESFGYSSSNLSCWVAEKSGGRWAAADVARIGLGEIRADLDSVVRTLREATGGRPIVVDRIKEVDLRAVCLALARAEEAGKRFIYRAGPPFVRTRIGQEQHAPLTPQECPPSQSAGAPEQASGGLIVVGSHVGVTTRQVGRLQERFDIPEVTIDVETVLVTEDPKEHLA